MINPITDHYTVSYELMRCPTGGGLGGIQRRCLSVSRQMSNLRFKRLLFGGCTSGSMRGFRVRVQGRAMGSCPFPENRVDVRDVYVGVKRVI